MKVKEFIELLKKEDPELEITVPDYEIGSSVEVKGVEVVDVFRHRPDTGWYCYEVSSGCERRSVLDIIHC